LKTIELVTRNELEGRLKDCLEQRQMPDYFLYLDDSGVRNWLTLDSSEEFPVASRLADLLRQNLPSIAQHLSGRFDLVSIGVGSGEKERMLLEALIQRGVTKYFAVDISSQMVDKALNTVADIAVAKTGLVAFLEDLARLRHFWNCPVLLCLLGNNFCNYEPDYLLEIVHDQLEPDDLFLFDCHLFPTQQEGEEPEREQVERIYHSEPNVRFNIDPLVQRGLDQNSCVFHLEILPMETSLGTTYKTNKWIQILKDTAISCGPNQVLFAAGDIIHMGFTYKYTCQQVQDYLQQYGFQKVELFLSLDGDNLLALIQKRPD